MGAQFTNDVKDKWNLHKQIADKASKIKGVDTSEEGVKEANKEGYEFELADAETFNLSENFDVIVAGALIEHLHNPGNFLDRAREHLRENGKLIISTLNIYSAMVFKRYILQNIPEGYVLGFNEFHSKHLLKQRGRKIMSIEKSHEQTPPLKTKILPKLLSSLLNF